MLIYQRMIKMEIRSYAIIKSHTFKQKLNQIFIHNIWCIVSNVEVRCTACRSKSLCQQRFAFYIMAVVAVAIVISTKNEKSCTDSHNARTFEKSSKIQRFTYLAITIIKLRKHHSNEFPKLFQPYDTIFQQVTFYKIKPIFPLELSLIMSITINAYFTERTFKKISRLHVFAVIFCID